MFGAALDAGPALADCIAAGCFDCCCVASCARETGAPCESFVIAIASLDLQHFFCAGSALDSLVPVHGCRHSRSAVRAEDDDARLEHDEEEEEEERFL